MKDQGNLAAVVKALRARGASVASLSDRGAGWPRVLAGYLGINLLLEVCNPQAMTEAQRDWHSSWYGQVHVVEDAEGAMALLDALDGVSRQPGGPMHEPGGFEPPKPWSPES